MEHVGMALLSGQVLRRIREFERRFSFDETTRRWVTLTGRTTFVFLLAPKDETSPHLARPRPEREADVQPSIPYFEVRDGRLLLHTYAEPRWREPSRRNYEEIKKTLGNLTWEDFSDQQMLPRHLNPDTRKVPPRQEIVTVEVEGGDGLLNIFANEMRAGHYDWL